MLLQASQEDLAIRHIIVALGALDVTNEEMLPLPESHGTQPRHQLIALEQYTKALRYMKVSTLQSKELIQPNFSLESIIKRIARL